MFDIYHYMAFSSGLLPSVLSFILLVQNCIPLIVETPQFLHMRYAALPSDPLKVWQCVKEFLHKPLGLLFTRMEGEKKEE